LNEESIVTQDEINQAEWENPDNWSGPKGLSIYFSKKDSRCFVPKQIRALGPTMNLGKTSGFAWLLFGTLFLIAIAFVIGKYAT
jgi:uncharacterized membrane protein